MTASGIFFSKVYFSTNKAHFLNHEQDHNRNNTS